SAAVTATVSYDAATRTATLTPSASLPLGRTYTVTVAGGAAGVKDAAGSAMAADFTSSFSTAALCPCTVFKSTEGPLGDALADSPVEVGMKFRSNQDGWITGLRFYKEPSNTRTHVAHLGSSTGQQLAEVTFHNETASGWQEQDLPAPVQITKDTTYITSYYAAGRCFPYRTRYSSA